ncbi:TPA: hypothetical protein KEY68_003361 [Providencia rettgeri]|uniref:hypothetical protein n=1 Tax=Providencia TaxID=586 RepID=UPI001B9198C5|nr:MULTISPECIES: hypothetical protein [Providencia]MDK7744968.1 hypothetical protein [Providencia rettgeri]MDK7757540.1 hypothetical protein [Providencia rettgeri]HBC7431065.1 hypothetical protein [Providencia rettgeri]
MIINKNITTPIVKNSLPLSNQKNKSFLNNINSVNNVGQEAHFPVKEQGIDKTFNISGKSEELHLSNQKLQANIIKSLLCEKYPDISLDMITKALDLGHSGNLQGQKLQYQPENALIILTLLTPKEIKDSKVLDCAANLIKQLNNCNNDKNFKQVLKSPQKALESELFDNALSSNNIDDLTQRFVDKYVKPAIKEKLTPFLSEKTIEELPMEYLFDTSLQETKKELIMEAKNQLIKHKVDKSVDRLLQFHNIFSALEQQIEIMGQLSVSINMDGNTENSVTTSPVKNTKPEDTVDSGTDSVISSNGADPASSKSTVNNYVINNYYSMPKELVTVNNEGIETSQFENKTVDSHTPESVQKNNPEDNENKASMPRFKSTLDIPQINNEQPAVLTGNALENSRSSANELRQSILGSSRDPSAQGRSMSSVPAESKLNLDINAFQPKSMVSAGRFEPVEIADKMTGEKKRSWQAKAPEEKNITLSSHGALTRNQAEKERYANGPITPGTERMGVPNNINSFSNRFKSAEIVDEATGKTKTTWKLSDQKTSQPVTLTEKGALTRNQVEKDRYGSGPIASGTEKMGIPNNTNTFSNRFKPAEIVDEVTGKTKKTWQLSDEKTSQTVTLTEMGALTRNQADKERYNDNATRSEKG